VLTWALFHSCEGPSGLERLAQKHPTYLPNPQDCFTNPHWPAGSMSLVPPRGSLSRQPPVGHLKTLSNRHDPAEAHSLLFPRLGRDGTLSHAAARSGEGGGLRPVSLLAGSLDTDGQQYAFLPQQAREPYLCGLPSLPSTPLLCLDRSRRSLPIGPTVKCQFMQVGR
jgi:hypothetical protein